MLPKYFDYIFVHLKQKVRLRPELSPKFLSTLGPNPTGKARPDLQLCFSTPLRFHAVTFRCAMLSCTAPNNPKPEKSANKAQKGALRRCYQTDAESWFIRVIE